MSLYGKLEYWEQRYTHSGDSGVFDWYQTHESLRHLLSTDNLMRPLNGQSNPKDHFPSREKCRVLILGCGNSTFGEDMMNDGWLGEIVNIDFSSVVIHQMMKRYNEKHDEREGKQFFSPKMKFVCADVTHGLPFGDNEFDLIICKGIFDAILCSCGSVNDAKRLVAECERVLAPGHGCLFVCSHGSPDNRLVFFEHENDPSYYWENIGIHHVPKQTQGLSK
eukprot:jgi/Psemu1/283062/fgenesh1_pg.19_\